MSNKIDVKLILNKKNGQMNFSLPKRKLSKEVVADIFKTKKMKICIEDL